MQNGYKEALNEAERLREEVKTLRDEQDGRKDARKKQDAALKEARSQQTTLKQKNQFLEAEVTVSAFHNLL